MSVIKASAIDLSQITFSDVKSDVHGRKMVFINRNGGKILVQTPKMYASNGIKRWRKKDAVDNLDDKFEMELSFYGENGSDKHAEELRTFHEKWKEFDEMIKTKVIEKSKEWLSMPKLDKATLESVMYTPMVKIPKDKEGNELPYPSRVRVKLDREMDSNGTYTGKFLSNKKFKTEILMFDESKEKLEMNENNAETVVSKGSQVICIMELVYLSLSKTTISTKWKLVQAKVFGNRDSITGYAMLDEDSASQQDDLDTENEVVNTTIHKEETKVVEEEEEEESEEEEEEEEEEKEESEEEEEEEIEEVKEPEPEPEPIPEPVVTKKVARTTTTRGKKVASVNA